MTWEYHRGKILDGCGLDWHLPWFKQLMFVSRGLGLNGDHQGQRMEQLFQLIELLTFCGLGFSFSLIL